MESIVRESVSTTEHIRKICEECKKETRILYPYQGGFFKPKLKGINYLEVGKSTIISNPLTIFLEWLVIKFRRLRDFLSLIPKVLFPRRARMYGERKDSRIVGRLIFARRHSDHGTTPIHHMNVEFWARTWWGQWRKLSDGYSDERGEFALPFDLRAARNWAIRKVQFEVYRVTYRYGEPGKKDKNKGPAPLQNPKPLTVRDRFAKISIRKKDLIGMDYSLNTIQLFYWEYRLDTLVPRVEINKLQVDAPEHYSEGRLNALSQQILPIELTKAKHLEQLRLAPETLSIEEIQRDYPENLTVSIERKLKEKGLPQGYTRGDDWFGERMMNGMNKGAFQPDPSVPGFFWMKYFGACHYENNHEYALPTVKIRYKIKPDGLPMPVKIHLTGPLNAYETDPWAVREFTPADGPHWLAAKRLARVTGAFCTEVDEHFAGTHINTEQYAIAAFRNLRRNPVAWLLLPHLKEVALINHTADKALITGYLTTATALTKEGINRRIRDIMGVFDWRGWQPMKPISAGHHYAQAEQLFWEVTGSFVDHFFSDPETMDEILRYWNEIYCFSEDLVNHSVPVFLSDLTPGQLTEREEELARERMEYYMLQYAFQPDLPREKRGNELKVVSPITRNPEAPDPGDLENLKQACRYIIMTATFMHTWINEHQYDDLGEILYSCGGLRFGEKPEGVLAPENDPSIAPDLTRATNMLFFTNLLSRTEYGFITRDEEDDVHPFFRNLLLDKTIRDKFERLGVNVDTIESRTNI